MKKGFSKNQLEKYLEKANNPYNGFFHGFRNPNNPLHKNSYSKVVKRNYLLVQITSHIILEFFIKMAYPTIYNED